LIDVAGLAARLGDPDCVVLDCRFDLARPRWGRESWAAGHVPGALFADLDHDLSSPAGPATGRHPLPSPRDFAARARPLGHRRAVSRWSRTTRATACSRRAPGGCSAGSGIARVAVLDGGYAAWVAAGQPVGHDHAGARTAQLRRAARRQRGRRCRFRPAPRRGARPQASRVRLVDARGADRFAGRTRPSTRSPATCPAPRTTRSRATSTPDGRLLPPAELRARWAQTLQSDPPAAMVAMCGSGVSACLNLLALEHAGLPGARLYPGSWSEWIRDPSRPVATGPRLSARAD
jgi:thiosulfate/3-mercaptopyruvate sulfurtransferase